jgi:hypothetical protein
MYLLSRISSTLYSVSMFLTIMLVSSTRGVLLGAGLSSEMWNTKCISIVFSSLSL